VPGVRAVELCTGSERGRPCRDLPRSLGAAWHKLEMMLESGLASVRGQTVGVQKPAIVPLKRASSLWQKANNAPLFLVMTVVVCIWYAFPLQAMVSEAQSKADIAFAWVKVMDNRPKALAFSPSFHQDGLVLFGSSIKDREHGIWRSTDKGQSWTRSDSGIPASYEVYFHDIEFSPAFAADNTVFASADRMRVKLGQPRGCLFRSRDGGQTWEEISMSGFPKRGSGISQSLLALALSPRFELDKTIFAVELTEGVFRSLDGGFTWQKVLAQKSRDVVATNGPAGALLVLAATERSGLWLSLDAGATWFQTNEGLEGASNFRQVLAVGSDQKPLLLALSSSGGIFWSANSGRSWERLGTKPASDALLYGMATTAQFPQEPYLACYTANGEVYLSEDRGLTWQDLVAIPSLGIQVDGVFLPPDFASSRILYASSATYGLFAYRRMTQEEVRVATATAAEKRVLSEAPTLEQKSSNRVVEETGCITYMLPLALMILGGWSLFKKQGTR
jgi:photosystem II stability/assembly factor-like uncharacterized protein